MTDPRTAIHNVHAEVAKLVRGQDGVIWSLLASSLVRGHVILEGVPGVAKTLTVKAMARAMGLDFARVQFTPDLMPSDVTGNLVYDGDSGDLWFRQGPAFTNLLLADEINRTPPKTQASLLEAMEERQISVEGEAHPLPVPFMVVATQNPVEYEGTYPLPEAQLDRFLLKLHVGYPAGDVEREILRMHDAGLDPHDLDAAGIEVVAGPDDLLAGAEAVTAVRVADDVVDYLVALAAETRRSPSLALGVSPRGTAMLLHVSKAWAWLNERDFVTPDDVQTLLPSAWRHRVMVRPEVELEGVNADRVLDGILERVTVPR